MTEYTTEDTEQLERVLRHISNVRASCELMGSRLIQKGEYHLGMEVIKRGLVHDNTKLSGVEFYYLRSSVYKANPELFKIAQENHWANWDHHPEHFGENGITQQSDGALAEMVCDWAARSSELGTDIHTWVTEEATKKYGFTMKQAVGKKINYYLKLLFDGKM